MPQINSLLDSSDYTELFFGFFWLSFQGYIL